MYRQKLKATANAFLKELEKHAQDTVWQETPEGASVDGAADQMEELTNHFGNLLLTTIAAGPLPDGQRPLFWQDMQAVFKRHKMPMRLTPFGDLELS